LSRDCGKRTSGMRRIARNNSMNILISEPIPTAGIALLKEKHDVTQADHVLSKQELIASIGSVDALICASTAVDAEVLVAAKKLKVISKLAVGYDNIDIEAAGKRNVTVTNAPGVLNQTVAEFAFAHILALARKVLLSDQYVRAGRFEQEPWTFDLMVGTEISGKTVGIIGFGSIGRSMVPMARGFGMQVLYTNRKGEIDDYASDPGVQYADKEMLLRESDIVVLIVPLTAETEHMITAAELSLMKQTALLVNMARGKVIKESDLVDALKAGIIAGAGLDVFEFEPKVSKELFSMPNTILTPHVGSATEEARAQLSIKAAQNAIAVLTGEACENIVNQQYLP